MIITEQTQQQIADLYAGGDSRRTICTKLHVSDRMVRSCIPKFRTISEANQIAQNRGKPELTAEQLQLILGSLLGDSSLIWTNKHHYLQMMHGKKQYHYLDHKRRLLGCPSIRPVYDESSFGKLRYVSQYHNKPALDRIAELVMIDNQKTVTQRWLDYIEPSGIAYWFMDDGTSSFRANKRGGPKNSVYARFCTESFTFAELELLQQLLNKFGIATGLHRCRRPITRGAGRWLVVRRGSINRLMELIKPHIIKSMMYKVKLIS